MSGQGKQMPGAVARDQTTGAGMAGSGSDQPGTSAPRPAAQPAASDGFDTWLHAELSRLYDTALSEPVPEDMLRLLQTAARQG